MFDMRAKRLQLFDKLLVATFDVMDGRDLGNAISDKTGNHKALRRHAGRAR